MRPAVVLLGLLRASNAALPDKCPIVTLPDVTDGGGAGANDAALNSCFKGCALLTQACEHAGPMLTTDPKQELFGFHTPHKNGGCASSWIGTTPPASAMPSSLIVHPQSENEARHMFETVNRRALWIVRTSHFYNVFEDFHQGTVTFAADKRDLPDSRLKIPGSHWNTRMHLNAAPMMQKRTLTPGYLVIAHDGWKDGKPTGFRTEGHFAEASFCFRTTYDRDTHHCRVRHPGNIAETIGRWCARMFTVFGHPILHPVPKHGPEFDCIRARIRGIGRTNPVGTRTVRRHTY